MPQLQLHNSLSGDKEKFQPLDASNITMYVCGPTVYDRPHLGNVRSVVVYDCLFRLLSFLFPKVTYVRNITDVDDKINKRALERGISIQNLTETTIKQFNEDTKALNCLTPTIEPKATEHISDVINMIEQLIKNDYAYEVNGHVFFDVNKLEGVDFAGYFYGKLSGKKLSELITGASQRLDDNESSLKKNPEDFVLWKPATDRDDISSVFTSPFGNGRPGWHIECSAMSSKYLGQNFDIHGGGTDLKFPHHENEIVQSICSHKGSSYAKYWVHNGFLTVNGDKMSKSLGNFITVREKLDAGINGEVLRFALLSSHYRKPLDFNDKLLSDSKKTIDKFYKVILSCASITVQPISNIQDVNDNSFAPFMQALCDDMNYPLAIAHLHNLAKEVTKALSQNDTAALKGKFSAFKFACDILGICQQPTAEYFKNPESNEQNVSSRDDNNAIYKIIPKQELDNYIAERKAAKKAKNFQKADEIRDILLAKNIKLIDSTDGTQATLI